MPRGEPPYRIKPPVNERTDPMTTNLQLVDQPEKPQRCAAENLKPGQFLAAGALTTGRPTEVLFVDTYPLERGGRETLLVHRALGVDWPVSSTVGGNRWFDLATEADLAAMHKQGEREQLANELHRLAEMILNPAMPVPQYGISMYASFKTPAEVRAAAEVFSLPVESRKPNAGIQTPEWPQDRKSYEQGIHLHWLTITDEPEPDSDASMEAHYDAEIDGQTPHPSWPTRAELKPWESLAPMADRIAESIEPSDPTGLAYSRADDEPEGDVTQQLGHRIEPHVGAVTEQGLVDETPGLIVGDTADEQRNNAYAAYERDEAEYLDLPRCPNCHGRHGVADGCH